MSQDDALTKELDEAPDFSTGTYRGEVVNVQLDERELPDGTPVEYIDVNTVLENGSTPTISYPNADTPTEKNGLGRLMQRFGAELGDPVNLRKLLEGQEIQVDVIAVGDADHPDHPEYEDGEFAHFRKDTLEPTD